MSEHLVVEPNMVHSRLDVFLHYIYPTASRTYFQKLISEGLVLVNGQIAKKSYQPEVGDEIEAELILNQEFHLTPEPISLDILYEDPSLIVVNKPSGMVVHPGYGNLSQTFANALLYHCKNLEINHPIRPGIIHRLDKETSGVLVAAKSASMHAAMSFLFAERKVHKRYLALCVGTPKNCTIRTNIGRHPVFRKKMAVLAEGGKDALTEIEVLATNGKISLVACYPKTGRTHQIRVHLRHAGYPILGDGIYGNSGINELFRAERVMLHAESIAFIHPEKNEPFSISARVPEDMNTYIEKLL